VSCARFFLCCGSGGDGGLFFSPLVSARRSSSASLVKNDRLTRVVAAGKVVGGVLLAADQLLRVEQLAVRARAHLVHDRRLEVEEDAAGHVLAGARLAEEGVEGVVAAAQVLVGGHLRVVGFFGREGGVRRGTAFFFVRSASERAREKGGAPVFPPPLVGFRRSCSPGHRAGCRAPGSRAPSRRYRLCVCEWVGVVGLFFEGCGCEQGRRAWMGGARFLSGTRERPGGCRVRRPTGPRPMPPSLTLDAGCGWLIGREWWV
jgi:hypothetical protein